MSCQKCGGFLVVAEVMDASEEYSRMWCQVLRCINCGSIDDAMIRTNKGPAAVSETPVAPRRGGRPPRPRTGHCLSGKPLSAPRS